MNVSLPKRSGTKAITYRVINVAVAFTWFSVVMGIEIGGIIALIDAAVSTLIYYLHERAWAKSKWGQSVE